LAHLGHGKRRELFEAFRMPLGRRTWTSSFAWPFGRRENPTLQIRDPELPWHAKLTIRVRVASAAMQTHTSPWRLGGMSTLRDRRFRGWGWGMGGSGAKSTRVTTGGPRREAQQEGAGSAASSLRALESSQPLASTASTLQDLRTALRYCGFTERPERP
jgi:hypothetical protein